MRLIGEKEYIMPD